MYLSVRSESLLLCQNVITAEDTLSCINSVVEAEWNLLWDKYLYTHNPQPRTYTLANASNQNNNVPNRWISTIRSNMIQFSHLNQILLHNNVVSSNKIKNNYIHSFSNSINASVSKSIKNLSFIILQKDCFAVVYWQKQNRFCLPDNTKYQESLA